MSKYIIELDQMPKTCGDCPCCEFIDDAPYGELCGVGIYMCTITGDHLYEGPTYGVENTGIPKPDNCPIKEVKDTKKRGEWLWDLADNGWADHTCSECGYVKNTDIHVHLGWKYCPNCGSYNGGKK